MLGNPNQLVGTAARKRWLRLPKWRPNLRRLHAWVALGAGLVLLTVVLSGSILLFQPELDKLIHPGLYDSTESSEPITPTKALHTVRREMPDFKDGGTVVLNRGIYEVYDEDFLRQVHVDPGSGNILGESSHEAGVLGFLYNLHACGLSCKDYPGYVPFLKTKVHILGNGLTIGGLVLGVAALVLVLLAISGLFLWWPGIKRMARGFSIRRNRGRYAINYDLHKVFGFVALPFLLMWAVTGASFEFKQVEDAWYAVTPGDAPPKKFPTFESEPGSGPGIDADRAERIALTSVPGSQLASVGFPAAGDRKGYYDFYVSDGWDGYRDGEWPGDAEVAVDRWSGRSETLLAGAAAERPMARVIWEDWSYPIHAGFPVGWIPRVVWLAFGLTPLLLAITGTTVWWIRRRKRRSKRGGRGRLPAEPPAEAVGVAPLT